jgi:hypothetical protein
MIPVADPQRLSPRTVYSLALVHTTPLFTDAIFVLPAWLLPSLLLTDIDTCESRDWFNQLCFLATSAVSLVCCKVTLPLRKALSTLYQRRFLRRRLRVSSRQPFLLPRTNSTKLSSHLVRRVPSFDFAVCHNLICNRVRRSGLSMSIRPHKASFWSCCAPRCRRPSPFPAEVRARRHDSNVNSPCLFSPPLHHFGAACPPKNFLIPSLLIIICARSERRS